MFYKTPDSLSGMGIIGLQTGQFFYNDIEIVCATHPNNLSDGYHENFR